MTLVFGHDDAVAEWVAARLPIVGETGFGPCAAIGVMVAGKLGAGVVYHGFREYPAGSVMEFSMAADTPLWAKPATIAQLLAYPFRQVGVWKVFLSTAVENKRAQSVARKVGFKQEAVLRHHCGERQHVVVMSMLQPEWKRRYGG